MMMYEMLREYKGYLLGSLSRATAGTYYKRLCLLFEGQPITDTARQLDVQRVIDKLGDVKYKNHFSQSKNAFLYFCEFQKIRLSANVLEKIEALAGATKKKHRKLKPVEYSHIDGKVKRLKNTRLKLSYQTMVATGLRVSELAGLSHNDCQVTAESITLHFFGKGGKTGTAVIWAGESPQLYELLKNQIADTPADKKVFYSAVYLQSKARELGFGCHDLRRAFAKLEYHKCRNKETVSEKLGHSNIRTTNIYLRSKVKV
ncbi:MAG: site-specific integrase [Oscillospiraceae bacterium]|nr:site-specific integrase [Oscillospiraceae bacterium]